MFNSDLKQSKAVLLVGAGISMLPPCSLPSGPALRDMATRSVLSHPATERFRKQIIRNRRYKDLIPEVLFQRLFEGLKERLFPFFEVLRLGRPNALHRSLATLTTLLRSPIFTTNFDTLIEESADCGNCVVHLHGDLRNAAALIARINQVGHGLSVDAKEQLRKALRGKTLYVLGYSGNDKDIMDAVSKQCPRAVWLVRDVNASSTMANVANAFGARAAIVVMDLRELGDMLSTRFNVAFDATRQKPPRPTAILRKWSSSIRVAERCAFAQKLALEIEDFELAVQACDEGMKRPSGIHTKHWFLSEAANCLRLLGRFTEARGTIEKAISSYSPPSDLATLAANYNVRGLILLDQPHPKPRSALTAFTRAKALLEMYENSPEARHWKSELKVFHARIENNSGLAYDALGQTDDAIRHFRTSLSLKKSAGDVIGRAQTCVNICRALYRVGHRRRFQYWRREAMRLIEKYSLRYQEAELLRETARLDCDSDHTEKALPKLRRALRLYDSIGADHDIRMTQQIVDQCLLADHHKAVNGRRSALKLGQIAAPVTMEARNSFPFATRLRSKVRP